MQLVTVDLLIFIAYVAMLITIGYLVSREKSGHQKNTQDYFLAGKALPWWAVGGLADRGAVLFALGVFWPRATANSALVVAIGSAALSLALKLGWPALPFMDRMGLVFLICLALAVVISLLENRDRTAVSSSSGDVISLGEISFATSQGFNLAAIGVTLILTALYTTWW